jgi:hypothetical protein
MAKPLPRQILGFGAGATRAGSSKAIILSIHLTNPSKSLGVPEESNCGIMLADHGEQVACR